MRISIFSGYQSISGLFFGQMRLACGVLLASCFLGAAGLAHAQPHWLKGTVQSGLGNHPIPFVKIRILETNTHFLSDIDGKFAVSCAALPCTLVFEAPLHRPAVRLCGKNTPADSLKIVLKKHQVFAYQTSTTEAAANFMAQAIGKAPFYNPANHRNFCYKTYNKFTLRSENPEKIRGMLQRAADFFDFVNRKLLQVSGSRHLLLSESVTKRDYLDNLHQCETLLNTRFTSITKPAMLTTNSATQPFTLYDSRIRISGNSYYSPLMPKALRWYHFELADSAVVDGEPLVLVRFSPRRKTQIAFLKGYLYLNKRTHALRYLRVWPAIDGESEVAFSQSYRRGASSFYFPYRTQTAIYQQPYGSGQLALSAVNSAILFDLNTEENFRKRDFSELKRDYFAGKYRNDESYWHCRRQGTFTPTDRATYAFYDSVGIIKHFDRFLRLGEGIYYGELPAGGINLSLKQFINYNEFEGLRIGFGGYTNAQISSFTSLGGYYGFGLGDNLLKYGFRSEFMLYKALGLRLRFAYKKDLEEAGSTSLSFAQKQFGSESIRNVRLKVFDMVSEKLIRLQLRVLKNLQLEGAFADRNIAPKYRYAFGERHSADFRMREFRLAFRYAHGERYFRTLYRKISLGTRFPVVWFTWRWGSRRSGSDYDLSRFDLQLRKAVHFAGFGSTKVQLSAGLVVGDVPYGLLYNGKGSYRNFAAIAHNSFETMTYNEFLSDRYVALFAAHHFGHIRLRKTKKQPSLEMLHHFGIGALRKPEQHFYLPFKTMEKGYFESGLFMNNVLVLKIPGLQAGLGAGIFIRYGAYAYPRFAENVLFKIALDLQH